MRNKPWTLGNISKLSLFLCVFAFPVKAANPGTADGDDWTLRTQKYFTGAVSYVPKNVACLEVNLSSICQQSPTAAQQKALDLLADIKTLVKNTAPDVTATDAAKPDLTPYARYKIQPKADDSSQNEIVDLCAKVAKAQQGKNLNQTVFSSSASVKFQTTKNVTVISALREKIGKYAESLKTSAPDMAMTVSVEQYVVDPAELEKETQKLDAESRLDDQKASRLSIDEEIYGKFTEKYTVAVKENARASFQSIAPTLDADGNSVLVAKYTFRIDYLPANTGSNSDVKSQKSTRGSLNKTVIGKRVVKTDYYKTSINLKTTCQKTSEAAQQVLQPVFATIMSKANEVVKFGPEGYKNRATVESIAIPAIDNSVYQEWSYGKNDKGQAIVKNYINICDGTITSTADISNMPQNYTLSQNIAITATSYPDLLALQNLVAQTSEGSGASAQAVVLHMEPLSPMLDDGNHQAAVEVAGYADAISKLLAPDGDLARTLIDEIGASEAYYEFLQYAPANDNLYGGGGAVMNAMMGAPGGAADAAPEHSSNAAQISDKNGPLQEVISYKEYTVRYRTSRNLIDYLNRVRKSKALKID